MSIFDHSTSTLHPAVSGLGIVGTVAAGLSAPTQSGLLIAAVASVLTILIQQLGSWLNQRRVSGDTKDRTAGERIADLEKKYDAALDELYKREAKHAAQITRLRAGIVRALRLFDACDRSSCPQFINNNTASERHEIEQLLYDAVQEDEEDNGIQSRSRTGRYPGLIERRNAPRTPPKASSEAGE